jgi:hypothetical protein
MNPELTTIHRRLVELRDAFEAIPSERRSDGPLDAPIRRETIELMNRAEALVPPLELPDGFRWDHVVHEGEAVHGFRVLPHEVAPPELWGATIRFGDAEAILSPYGLEVRPTWGGDFFLIKVGSHHVRDAGRRVRLIGPRDGFEQVAHLFAAPDPPCPT